MGTTATHLTPLPSSSQWASSALQHTEQATVHEKLLKALTSLIPHCNWGGLDSTKLKGILGRVRKSWKGLDKEWRKELEM